MALRLRTGGVLGLLWVAVVVAAAPAAGQRARYARPVGDTLRFREVVNASATFTVPEGTAPFISRQASLIALTFPRADSAVAWYEDFFLEASDANGVRTPNPLPVLRQPFHLLFSDRGAVRTVSTPPLPSEVEDITDLTRQFHDFFPRFPRTAIAIGVAWSDTVMFADTNAVGRFVRATSVTRYRVERDTTIAGGRAIVVATERDLTFRIGAAGAEPHARTTLTGGDTGSFLFSLAQGRLLRLSREGLLEGVVHFASGPGPTEVAQAYRYSDVVEAVP